MRILSAFVETDEGSETVSPEQIKADMPEIERIHRQGMKDDPHVWPFFGGIVRIGERKYQVVDK